MLTDELAICTLNIKMGSDREELKAFLQEMKFKASIVCLQELRDDRDLMELLDHLKEAKSKFTYCARSSHSHCAVLSTLPLQEVKDYFDFQCMCLCHYPQVIRDNLPSQYRRIKYAFGQAEFVTVKVQGILVTCLHLPHVPTDSDRQGREPSRIKEIKRIWEKIGLW